jgi:K+-sensing histidine kinase KdpD
VEVNPRPTQGPADAELLGRIQQDNQRQILGKLVHDLRNPVHSIRISMELFGRLARRSGDVDKLMERAAAYIEPAEAAVENLLANSERLAKYLASPAAPQIVLVSVHELLPEIAMLLRAAKRRLQVSCTLPESDPALKIHADRPRLSHVLLHCCLNNAIAGVALSARGTAGEHVCVDAAFQSAAADNGAYALPLGAEELRILVETAGGTILASPEGTLSLCFRRWTEPFRPA